MYVHGTAGSTVGVMQSQSAQWYIHTLSNGTVGRLLVAQFN